MRSALLRCAKQIGRPGQPLALVARGAQEIDHFSRRRFHDHHRTIALHECAHSMQDGELVPFDVDFHELDTRRQTESVDRQDEYLNATVK